MISLKSGDMIVGFLTEGTVAKMMTMLSALQSFALDNSVGEDFRIAGCDVLRNMSSVFAEKKENGDYEDMPDDTLFTLENLVDNISYQHAKCVGCGADFVSSVDDVSHVFDYRKAYCLLQHEVSMLMNRIENILQLEKTLENIHSRELDAYSQMSKVLCFNEKWLPKKTMDGSEVEFD